MGTTYPEGGAMAHQRSLRQQLSNECCSEATLDLCIGCIEGDPEAVRSAWLRGADLEHQCLVKGRRRTPLALVCNRPPDVDRAGQIIHLLVDHGASLAAPPPHSTHIIEQPESEGSAAPLYRAN